jgi:hypothetical protein
MGGVEKMAGNGTDGTEGTELLTTEEALSATRGAFMLFKDHFLERTKRPKDGLYGWVASTTFNADQQQLIDDIKKYNYNYKTIEEIRKDLNTFVQRGRVLFSSATNTTKQYPRISRFFETFKRKNGSNVFTGGYRRTRKYRRGRGRRTHRRRNH